MGRPRVVYLLLLSCAVSASIGCGRRDAAPRVDSSVDSARPVAAVPKPSSDWASEFGQMLVVPSDSDNAAVVLYPDEPSARLITSAPMVLVNAAGDTTRVRLIASDSQQCGDALVVRMAGPPPSEWSVGLLGSSARVLHVDSIEGQPSMDSARLAADLARLASALSTHKDSRFSGLPFAVLGAHRFEADGRQFLVGHLARRLAQEASPLEERTLIIAERPDSKPAIEPYVVTFSLRSEGSEDTAEHFEVLTAVRGRQSILLLLARDRLSQTNYELLERSPGGTWRTRWTRKLEC